MSILEWMNLPPAFGTTLLLLTFTLMLSPYLSGTDLGVLRIPEFNHRRRRVLIFIGPVLFASVISLFLPVLSKDAHGKGASLLQLPPCLDATSAPSASPLQRGVELYDQEAFASALDCYEVALATAPNSGLAWMRKGNAHMALGRQTNDLSQIRSAISALGRAIETSPATSATALYNRGNAYGDLQVMTGDVSLIERRLDDYNRSIALVPGHLPAYYNRGLVHKERGALDLALADFVYIVENINLCDTATAGNCDRLKNFAEQQVRALQAE